MSKQLISAGQVQVRPHRFLDFVLEDSPTCQGKREYLLCPFSNVECKNRCYENQSKTCATYHYLERTKSHYDKLGANLR